VHVRHEGHPQREALERLLDLLTKSHIQIEFIRTRKVWKHRRAQ
jgi:hypothetical protein